MMRMRTTNNIDEFELLNTIKTHVLKVNINCQGCVKKVRKQLLKIQGVYSVNIDKEEEKITVVGTIDCATLTKRLARSGKHAEPIWSTHPIDTYIDPPILPRNNNIQTLQLMENEQTAHHENATATFGSNINLSSNYGIGSDSSEGHNDHFHHQLSAFEDYVSSGGGGAVAVPMPLYEHAGQYSPLPVLPTDYKFYLQSQSQQH